MAHTAHNAAWGRSSGDAPTQQPTMAAVMSWGTGLGFRYYTPIGPVRLDVGFPLQSIDGDPPVQIYVSIGQSF